MPWGDGTGPWWAGNRGWNCRRGFGRGFGQGFGRGFGQGFGRGGFNIPFFGQQQSANQDVAAPAQKEELQELKEYSQELKQELDEIKKRMAELQKKK